MLIFAESSDDGLITHKWTQFRNDFVGGRTGALGFPVQSGNPDVRRRKTFPGGDPAIHSTWIIGFAIAAQGMGSDTRANGIIRFYNGNFGATQFLVAWLPATRQIDFRRDGGATIWATSPVLDIGVWHYVEIKFTLDNVNGYAEARMDGEVLGTFSGDTLVSGTPALDTFQFRSDQSFVGGGQISFDDLYVLNGTAPNNDFLGDTKVYNIVPDGNGAHSELTGSDGDSINNWQLVDELTNPNTTDFVGSSVPNRLDTYTLQDIVDVQPDVAGVVVRSYAAKSTTGTRRFRPVLRKDGVDHFGTDTTLATSFAAYSEFYDETPDGFQWTKDIVNALEAGFQVRT